jgi:Fe-S cluster assembly iron-binding protein IscA
MAERPLDGDEIVEKDGLKVFVERDVSMCLGGMEVDYIDEGETKGFVMRDNSPSSGSECGCGK